MSLGKKIKKFWSLPFSLKWLIFEVVIFSAIIRFFLVVFSFKKITPFLKKEIKIETKTDDLKIKQIGFFIEKICKHTPWKSPCLVQAIVGKWMLQRRHIASTLFLGVAKNKTDDLKAHAWLKSGNLYLTGYQEMGDYQSIANF